MPDRKVWISCVIYCKDFRLEHELINNRNVVTNLLVIGNNRRIPPISITNHQQCANYGQGNDK